MSNDYHGKSVTFDLPEESTIRESPLLTPKHEEEDEEQHFDSHDSHFRHHHHQHHNHKEKPMFDNNEYGNKYKKQRLSKQQLQTSSHSQSYSSFYHPSTPPYIDNKLGDGEDEEEEQKIDNSNVEQNPDYISLTSSINISSRTSEQINQEIVELSNLKRYFQTCNKEDLIEFYIDLLNGKINLPQPHRLITSPKVNWSKYHPSLSQVEKDFETHLKNEKGLNDLFYKTFKLFDKV